MTSKWRIFVSVHITSVAAPSLNSTSPIAAEACFGEALGLFGKDTKLHLHKFSLNSNNILEILSLAQHESPAAEMFCSV
jgi:hypothetical protein